MNIFNGIYGKVANGMCRMSMDGGIAVKTDNGYKTWNNDTKRLVNCSDFVFDIGEEFFFVFPTNKVEPGDIIIATGKPKYVLSVDDDILEVINYENSTVEKVLPERHVFMGNTYFYGKIVSMFGNAFNGKKGTDQLMKYWVMSEMMKGMVNNSAGGMMGGNTMLPFMLMGGNFGSMFDGMFDFGSNDADDKKGE